LLLRPCIRLELRLVQIHSAEHRVQRLHVLQCAISVRSLTLLIYGGLGFDESTGDTVGIFAVSRRWHTVDKLGHLLQPHGRFIVDDWCGVNTAMTQVNWGHHHFASYPNHPNAWQLEHALHLRVKMRGILLLFRLLLQLLEGCEIQLRVHWLYQVGGTLIPCRPQMLRCAFRLLEFGRHRGKGVRRARNFLQLLLGGWRTRGVLQVANVAVFGEATRVRAVVASAADGEHIRCHVQVVLLRDLQPLLAVKIDI